MTHKRIVYTLIVAPAHGGGRARNQFKHGALWAPDGVTVLQAVLRVTVLQRCQEAVLCVTAMCPEAVLCVTAMQRLCYVL